MKFILLLILQFCFHFYLRLLFFFKINEMTEVITLLSKEAMSNFKLTTVIYVCLFILNVK